MAASRVEITLRRASDDPAEGSAGYQTELNAFAMSLRSAGLRYSQSAMAFDAVDVIGYPVGHFVLDAVKDFGPTVGLIIVAWLQGRAGRKVRLKVGDIEAEATTAEEVERLIRTAGEMRSRKPDEDRP